MLSIISDVIFCRRQLASRLVPKGLFSCPFVDSNLQINTAPRSVAYYEVQISRGYSRVRSYSNFNGHLPNDLGLVQQHLVDLRAADNDNDLLPECVAVGLSSAHFNADARLPGWDLESFGYHGDDGCLFHGKGVQISEYGPRFGAGDTVGCGINYRTRRIFFTLNGAFLGDAFAGISGQLYPTVGIDAEVSVMFNFGRAPFAFDVLKYEGSVATTF
jgi:hypothetical protein